MQIIDAELSKLSINEFCEGELTFQWPDPISGYEELNIDPVGFCSRRMPIHSGRGIESIELRRESMKLRFTPELAQKLKLTRDVEFRFVISDAKSDLLRKVVDLIQGKYE